MTKLDPIIAVKDVNVSADWYKAIFNFKRIHGGDHFAVLATSDDEIILCFHRWEAHNHPTMQDESVKPGNGLILYFRTEDIIAFYNNAKNFGCTIKEEIHLNANSLKREFSITDPDGYYLTITEFHKYEG